MPSYSGVWTLTAVYQAVGSGNWTNDNTIGLFAGGFSPATNVIDRVSINTTGNATSFGDLSAATYQLAGCASSTRGLFGGGTVAGTYTNTITYVTFASPGTSTNFGNLVGSAGYGIAYLSACSNSTRGIFGGGYDGAGPDINVIQYVTIATTGDATDFGDLVGKNYHLSACASPTRGVFGGGFSYPNDINVIQYITIASTGNATNFGNLTVARYGLASCSSSTRGLFAGGTVYATSTVVNVIDYITIASTGNATDFGDLTTATTRFAACSSSTRGLFGGGYDGANDLNVINYVTIATTGNSTDFGDLTLTKRDLAGCSNSHGGL